MEAIGARPGSSGSSGACYQPGLESFDDPGEPSLLKLGPPGRRRGVDYQDTSAAVWKILLGPSGSHLLSPDFFRTVFLVDFGTSEFAADMRQVTEALAQIS